MTKPEKYVSGSMKSVSEVYRVQILLAYFLNRIDQLCTPEQLLEIATGEDIVNYFDYAAAVSAMLENGTLELAEIDGVEYYRLTERGASGAEDFKKQIPRNLRDKIYASGLRLFAQLKNERDIKLEITKQGEGFGVRCICCDGLLTLFDISLFAPNEEQARFIGSKIRMNPTDIYRKIMDHIIENEQYIASFFEVDEAQAAVEMLSASGTDKFAELKSECEISFGETKPEEGCNVHCSFCDGTLTLLEIGLFAPDEEQARFIKSKIEVNPTDFYWKIMDYIIENEEYVPSISGSDDEEG